MATAFYVYGDTFLRKLCPLMKEELKIGVSLQWSYPAAVKAPNLTVKLETRLKGCGFRISVVKNELTLKRGTAAKLLKKLREQYKRENRELKTRENKDAVLVMVGTYDIMNFREGDNFHKFSKQIRRNLTLLVFFLTKYHRQIILLTAIPVLKAQNERNHWHLLRDYNRNIKKLSRRKNVRMVNMFPAFLENSNPPRCNHRLYHHWNCPPRDAFVMWNFFGMRLAIECISQAVANVHKLDSSNAEKRIQKDEVYGDKSVMNSKFDDVCLDDGRECTAVNYFTGGGVIDRNTKACVNQEIGQFGCMHSSMAGSTIESIYNANTVHLMEDIKQKLSWIRFTDYTSYGSELVKSNKMSSVQNELLTVATYNVLSQDLLEKHNYLYSQHDHRSLKWSIRRDILLEELVILDADILCLQEIDFQIVEPFYDKFLLEQGYQGVYKRRTHDKNDGCAIYFRSNKFNLVDSSKVEFFKESVRLLDKDNVGIILKLSLKSDPSAELIVATTHLLYNPKRMDIKLAQTQLMLAEMERLAYKRTDPATGNAEYLPIIFTGDMNYSPQSAVYRLVTESQLDYEDLANLFRNQRNIGYVPNKTLLPESLGVTDSCQYASQITERGGSNKCNFSTGTLNHPLNLSSVYNHMKKNQPEATTNQGNWVTVDYIFYSCNRTSDNIKREGNLKLISKLSLPNVREAEFELRYIPNLACASDHLPLLATFHLTGS